MFQQEYEVQIKNENLEISKREIFKHAQAAWQQMPQEIQQVRVFSCKYMTGFHKNKKFGFKNLENKSIFDFDVIQLCESYACKK